MRFPSALTIATVLGCGSAFADGPPPRVVGPAEILGGTSMIVRGVEVRLWGLALPSPGAQCQVDAEMVDCRDAAARQLARLTEGRHVLCRRQEAADGEVMLAKCSAGEGDIGSLMLSRGLAVAAADSSDDLYRRRQETARAEGLGVWAP